MVFRKRRIETDEARQLRSRRQRFAAPGGSHDRLVRLLAFVLPVVLLLLLPFNHVFAALAVLSHVTGVLTLRWLFFAQAEHVVGLYYGKR